MNSSQQDQQGIALVVAMLIMAISAVIATEIFYQQQLNIRRTMNQLQAEKLYQAFISTEEWVKIILQTDIEQADIDYLGEAWAQELTLFTPPENMRIQTKLQDQQGCFNLNNLVLKGKADLIQIKQLQQLFIQLELEPELIWALVDWLDADDEPHSEGAEWETYSRLQPSARAANYRMFILDELYAIANWTDAVIQKIKPFICVLPPAPEFNLQGRYFLPNMQTKLNINTASIELLQHLNPKMLTMDLTKIAEIQHDAGFKNVDEFLQQLDLLQPSEPALSSLLDKTMLSVASNYFLLNFSGQFNELELNYQSLIYRHSATEIYTLSRQPIY